jgi:hypothetical protein
MPTVTSTNLYKILIQSVPTVVSTNLYSAGQKTTDAIALMNLCADVIQFARTTVAADFHAQPNISMKTNGVVWPPARKRFLTVIL